MELRLLQRWMNERILRPERLEGSPTEARLLESLLRPSDARVAIERLGAHTGGYPARLFDALSEAVPAVRRFSGERAFAELVRRYVRTRPPRSYNLNHAARELPRFLGNDPETKRLPFLPDLATLEVAIQEAFHSPHRTPAEPAALGDLPPDALPLLVLELQPGTAVVSSTWPIFELWSLREESDDRLHVDLRDRGESVLVRRRGLEVFVEPVSRAQAKALEVLLAGRTLGDMAAALTGEVSRPEEVQEWFGRWMGLGLVAGWKVRTP